MATKFSPVDYVSEAQKRFHYSTMRDFLVAAHCHKYGVEQFDQKVVDDAVNVYEQPNPKVPDFALYFARHLNGEGKKKRQERQQARQQPAMVSA